MASSYKNLAVWQKAHQLTLDIYQMTAALPKDEMYGLSSQIKRAAASIPANIAEGSGRGSDGELARFLRIAMGSAYELEYHILLAHDLGFANETSYQQLDKQVDEVIRMLAGLIKSLNTQRLPYVQVAIGYYQLSTNSYRLKTTDYRLETVCYNNWNNTTPTR